MSRQTCAIYTRKSTEEGLEQDFNSLDAQRAACEAYIASQAGEGWFCLKARYDDGAYSGGNMERPALQALLRDIREGHISVVVVYKVDRLTRSLTDFAKLVELFDERGVSFVSVTQQFNTTSSMGRLTLNVLLSFAQFEREVTAERISDKIAASKKKGMWMGGAVPLGYDAKDRKLLVKAPEAETVRTLFQLYRELGNVTLVQRQANRLGLRTKLRQKKCGRLSGGAPFTRGHLYQLLANPLYIGEITHKGQRYPGQHQAIVDRQTWDAVEDQLRRNAVTRQMKGNAKSPSLLAGLLIDGHERPMKAAHACKGNKRYRYYITRPPEGFDQSEPPPSWRFPASVLEQVVLQGLSDFLKDHRKLCDAVGAIDVKAEEWSRLGQRAAELQNRVSGKDHKDRKALLSSLLRRIEIREGRLHFVLNVRWLTHYLLGRSDRKHSRPERDYNFEVPLRCRKRGAETKLIIAAENKVTSVPDPNLIKTVKDARLWYEELRRGEVDSLTALARRHKTDRANVGKTLPLAFLAPPILEAILEGRQPVELTATRLKRGGDLPLSWQEQARFLGLD